jgi:shikimate 5-dehydrogenase
MPLKTAILQHLDDISPSSKATRACNTIVLEKQADGTRKLIGTNTDVLGEFLAELALMRLRDS